MEMVVILDKQKETGQSLIVSCLVHCNKLIYYLISLDTRFTWWIFVFSIVAIVHLHPKKKTLRKIRVMLTLFEV